MRYDAIVRRALVFGLVALGFVGVYLGVTLIVSRPAPPESIREPAPSAPASPVVPRRVETPPPAAPPPAPRAPASAAVVPAPAAEPRAVPTTGVLNIDSDVPGAEVFVDRQFVGAAPIAGYEIKPGSHRVNVSATGFEGVAETIDVAPGPRDLVIKLREVRLHASLDVIHKHRIGSCKGRLVATPLGITYETSDRDDAFSTALLDLESFEVDYLKKNLRLKLTKGKTFDFTDPDGNADRLFVFHRDVDHARDRLRKGDPPATR
jgi:hypothetical protein